MAHNTDALLRLAASLEEAAADMGRSAKYRGAIGPTSERSGSAEQEAALYRKGAAAARERAAKPKK